MYFCLFFEAALTYLSCLLLFLQSWAHLLHFVVVLENGQSSEHLLPAMTPGVSSVCEDKVPG